MTTMIAKKIHYAPRRQHQGDIHADHGPVLDYSLLVPSSRGNVHAYLLRVATSLALVVVSGPALTPPRSRLTPPAERYHVMRSFRAQQEAFSGGA